MLRQTSVVTSTKGVQRFFGKKNEGDQTRIPILFNRKFDPEEIRRKLEEVNERLLEPEKEMYGKYRGRHSMMKRLRDEAPSKRKRGRIDTQVIMAHIATLVFQRFALQLGQMRLKEVKPNVTGQVFFGPETKQIIMYKQARIILLELWRYGESSLLESYRVKHEAHMARKRHHEAQTKANKEIRELERSTTDATSETKAIVDEKRVIT